MSPHLLGLFDGLERHRIPLAPGTELVALVAPAVGQQRGILVWVHGFTGSKEDFLLVLPDLARLGWTSVAPDLRGTFESTGTAPWTRQQHAADLVAVADWAGGRFGIAATHLVGHSYGGLVAQQSVADHPGRFASLTVLCSGPAGLTVLGAAGHPVTIARLEQFRSVLARGGVEAAWAARAQLEGLDRDDMMVRFLRERFVTSDRDALLQSAVDLLESPDLVPGVLATRTPVRWAFGAGDGSWSQALQRETAARYGTTAHVFAAPAAHSPALESDEATTAWLDAALTGLTGWACGA